MYRINNSRVGTRVITSGGSRLRFFNLLVWSVFHWAVANSR